MARPAVATTSGRTGESGCMAHQQIIDQITHSPRGTGSEGPLRVGQGLAPDDRSSEAEVAEVGPGGLADFAGIDGGSDSGGKALKVNELDDVVGDVAGRDALMFGDLGDDVGFERVGDASAVVSHSVGVTPGAVVRPVDQLDREPVAVCGAVETDHREVGDRVDVILNDGGAMDAGTQPGAEGSKEHGDGVGIDLTDRDEPADHVVARLLFEDVVVDRADNVVELFPRTLVDLVAGCGCQGGEPRWATAGEASIVGVEGAVEVHDGLRSFGSADTPSDFDIPDYVPVDIPELLPDRGFLPEVGPDLGLELW